MLIVVTGEDGEPSACIEEDFIRHR
jgi:hypothetical protein